MFDHETRVLLLEVIKSAFGFGIAAAPIAVLALRKRGKQNHHLAERLAAEVILIRAEVRKVSDVLERSQALTAIHTDKLNDTNARIAQLTIKIDEIETMLPQIEKAMFGVESYFERAKQAAALLKEKPIAGSGGKVALKSNKEES